MFKLSLFRSEGSAWLLAGLALGGFQTAVAAERVASAERAPLLQFLAAMVIFVGTPLAAVLLVIRGIARRRREYARWRDCARRNGWSEAKGPALLAGGERGLAWTLRVEGSDDDHIVWRASSLAGPGPGEQDRLAAVAGNLHGSMLVAVRERLPLRDFTFDSDAKSIALLLRNRDLSCEEAEALVKFGLAITRQLTGGRS